MMDGPVYYSKIQFTESCRFSNAAMVRRIILNLPAHEISLQVFRSRLNHAVIFDRRTENICGREIQFDFKRPAYWIRNEHTEFRPVLLPAEEMTEDVIFSYGKDISDDQMKGLLPLCNALEYEPFRGKVMSMDDPGYIGYRDEITVSFDATTDSYIPQITLPMDYYYDKAHMWPQEKLYCYVIKTFFEGDKKLRGWAPTYGGGSLFL